MSLRNTVSNAVDKAFDAAGDLVQTGKLSSKKVTGYDFAGGGETVSTSSTKIVDVILTNTKKPTSKSFETLALLKSGIDVSIYSTITINKKLYNIESFADDDFVVTLVLAREIS
jgi:hypothetical protein